MNIDEGLSQARKGDMALSITEQENLVNIEASANTAGFVKTSMYEVVLKLNDAIQDLKKTCDPMQLKRETTDGSTKIDPQLLKIITPAAISTNLKGRTKTEILQELTILLANSGQVCNWETVLQDIRSSKAVGEYLEPMGAEMETWKVGRAFAARKLREIEGIYGGELAGHYYFRDFFYSDSGIMASLIILGIVSRLKREGVKLSQAIAGIEKYRNSGEINFKIEQKEQAMEAVCNYFKNEEQPTAFMDFDGYRVEFKQWWFNIRPSNTEPYLRFIAEAKTDELLEQKVKKAREIISKFK